MLAAGPRVLADLPLAIDPAEVLRFQGYQHGRDIPTPDVEALLEAGCDVVGACCGSGPDHIRLIAEVVRSRRTR